MLFIMTFPLSVWFSGKCLHVNFIVFLMIFVFIIQLNDNNNNNNVFF